MTDTIAAPPRFITYVPLTDLTPAPRNPKRHELELLIDAIRMHGLVEVPVVDERTQCVLHGHGRREALIEMQGRGMTTPAESCSTRTRGGSYPYCAAGPPSLTTRQKPSRSNSTASPARGWDPREFAAVLEDLATGDAELFDSLAIPADEMDKLFSQVDPETLPGGIREDEPATLHLADDGDEHGDGLSPDDDGRAAHTTCPACGHLFNTGR